MGTLIFGRIRHRVRGRDETVVHGFRQLAQAGRLIDRFADHRVLEALLGSDVARDDLPRRHADTGLTLRNLRVQSLGDPLRRVTVSRTRPNRCATPLLEFILASA